MLKKSLKTVALTAALAGTLGLGVVSAGVAAAETPSPSAGHDGLVGSRPHFSDTSTSIFNADISWAQGAGISGGYADGTFRPNQVVTREAMAAFMYRLAGSPAFTAPAVSPFSDVPTTDQFYKEITWLASTKITTGYADGTFKPLDPVARDAMAVFMYRFVTDFCTNVPGVEGFQPPASDTFSDVSSTTMFAKEISWAKASGISTGYADHSFQIHGKVSREAMAAFLHRLDNFVTSHGCTTSPTPSPSPTDTASPEPTDSATPAPTDTATPAPTDSATPVPTDTATPAPTDTATPAPTDTATPAPTDTATATPAP